VPFENQKPSAQGAQRARILMVDDHPANLVALDAILAPLGEELVAAQTGTEALRALLKDDFAVILLDVQMPGMDGFELASLIKTRERCRRTPIIFLTAIHREPSKIFLGYAQGAVDYLLKPFDPEILRSKVSVFVELWKKNEQLKASQASIFARERAEQERRSEVRYRALTDSMPGCIWAADPQGRIYYANRRWLELSGRETDGPGFDFLTALPEEDQARVRAAWGQAVVQRTRLEIELKLRTAEGEFRWHLFRAEPEHDDAGALVGWIATAFDVDAQKRLEEERTQLLERETAARAHAEVANRAKDDFLATVSHELRTPLTAILGWTRMLRTGAVEPEALPRALETIERNARVQAQLIEDILDVSRIVTGKMRLEPRPIDLRSVLQVALETVRPSAAAKGVELASALPETVVQCTGDPDRLQQVISNLLTNAIKFTPRGGRVTAHLEREGAGDACVARLCVIDTGAGITPEFLPHVFERFRQADSSMTRTQGGLGLGLAIVRHLVELHGGRVNAHSDGEGKGASFEMVLPVVPEARVDVPAIAMASSELRVKALGGLKVLVVDDEPDAREMLVEVLRLAGAEVCAAGDADEAVDVLLRERPDLLLSDIGLPREDGYALLRRIRQLEPATLASIPAAALTAYATAEDGQLAAEAGFQRHIAKPVEPAELTMVLADLAGRVDELRLRRDKVARQKAAS
jgi:PAS domain S-box-containing protein